MEGYNDDCKLLPDDNEDVKEAKLQLAAARRAARACEARLQATIEYRQLQTARDEVEAAEKMLADDKRAQRSSDTAARNAKLADIHRNAIAQNKMASLEFRAVSRGGDGHWWCNRCLTQFGIYGEAYAHIPTCVERKVGGKASAPSTRATKSHIREASF